MPEEMLEVTFERGSHTFEWTHICFDGEHLLVEVQLTVVKRGEKPRHRHESVRDHTAVLARVNR